jgi:hydroxyacylglutathione hydrolase
MGLDVVTVPCLSDNYAYLVKGPDGVGLVDAPEAAPIVTALKERGWTLDTILLTHHHHDHVGGVTELVERYGCSVAGPAEEAAKMPPLHRTLREGDTGEIGGARFEVIAVPGHTLGHLAFHFPTERAVFTADSLMALGCGRVFEGTPEMMWDSLSKLAALPSDTVVYSGHEYTAANARFAQTIEPDNTALSARVEAVERARAEGRPTAQVALSEELRTNPFLRAGQAGVKRALDMEAAGDAECFAEIRQRKDRF